MGTKITIEDLATFCKKKGFVFSSSEIYGGFSGFFDLGPLGVELMNNIKQSFWKYFVLNRDDMVGIEASIISHPRTWKASGHLESFGDLVISCKKCKGKHRADHLIEDTLNIPADGMKSEEINKLLKDKNIMCPNCKGEFEDLKDFNLLFETSVGAAKDKASTAYLRGETAQAMFMDFKQVYETSRMKLPFGIAQIGRCFRNEIAPRDFLFRSREFHIGEFEFFIHPKEKKCELLDDELMKLELNLLDAQTQDTGKKTMKKTTISKMLKSKKLGEWHAYWLGEQANWLLSLGLDSKNLKIREHTKAELSHYSSATFDLDYNYPFGSKELAGNANRGQFDLGQHIKESGKKLEVFDEKTKEKVIPRVIEPTFGIERIFLAVLTEAYNDDKKRGNVVLKLDPKLSPYKVAVLPLVSNKEEIVNKAREIYEGLKEEFNCFFDESGSLGRRYSRQDEIGTMTCCTIDFETLEDNKVTLRSLYTTNQIRVSIFDLKDIIRDMLSGKELESLGETVTKS